MSILLISSVMVGAIHALAPDHWLPFVTATIALMLLQIHLAYLGVSLLRSHWLEHAFDVIAGGVIAPQVSLLKSLDYRRESEKCTN